MNAGRILRRLCERIPLRRLLELATRQDHHMRPKPVTLRHSGSNASFKLRSVGSGLEDRIAALDICSDVAAAVMLEQCLQRFHGQRVVAHDIDATKKSD